jgi:hypothetical protein
MGNTPKRCLKCRHYSNTLDAGGLCNHLTLREGAGDPCGCRCTFEHEEPTDEIVDKRVALYGDPVDTFVRIAQVWSGITGFDIKPIHVPLMQAGMKLVRTEVSPDYSDNSDDVDGYMDIFRRLVGEDMIHARTPQEYWAQKEANTTTLAMVMAKAEPPCIHCGEEEAFHNPTTGQCAKPGHDHSRFEVKA